MNEIMNDTVEIDPRALGSMALKVLRRVMRGKRLARADERARHRWLATSTYVDPLVKLATRRQKSDHRMAIAAVRRMGPSKEERGDAAVYVGELERVTAGQCVGVLQGAYGSAPWIAPDVPTDLVEAVKEGTR